MPEVVEAHLGRQPGLCKEASEGTHNRISAADLTLCVREDEAGVLPGRCGHPLLELAPLVRLEDRRRSGADANPPLLAGLGGGDSRPGACVRSARVMRASSRVPSAAESRRDASSCERARMGLCPRVAAFFTRAVGSEGMRLSSTAWFRAVERTPCMTPTVFGFSPSSILRTLNERTWAAFRSRSLMRPKNGIRWFWHVLSYRW